MSSEDFADRELRLAADAFASGWAGARDVAGRSTSPSPADPMGPFGVLLGVLARHSRHEIEEGYIEKVLLALEEAMNEGEEAGAGGEGEEGGAGPERVRAGAQRGSPPESLWEHPRPRGYERWAISAASALTGRYVEWTHEAEEILLEWLSPGWPAAIVGAEESDYYPEGPAERARHRVWALHRAVGFARESPQLIVEVPPPGERTSLPIPHKGACYSVR